MALSKEKQGIDISALYPLIEKGAHLFPVGEGKDGKLPAKGFKWWHQRAASLVDLNPETGDRNWAIVPGKGPCPAMVIDVDNEDLFHRVVDTADEFGLSPFANIESRTSGSRHLWYRIPKGLEIGNHLWGFEEQKGGEIRSANGFVVMWGAQYGVILLDAFRNSYLSCKPCADTINAFLDRIRNYKPNKETKSVTNAVSPFLSAREYTPEELRDVLRYIDPDEGYDDWIRTMFAFKRAGGRREDWMAHCAASKSSSPNEDAKKWDDPQADHGAISIGTLIDKAKRGGFTPKKRSKLSGLVVNHTETEESNVSYISETAEIEHEYEVLYSQWLDRKPIEIPEYGYQRDCSPKGIVPGRLEDGTPTGISCINFEKVKNGEIGISSHAEVAQFEAWLATLGQDVNHKPVVPDRYVEGIGWRKWYSEFGWQDISIAIAQNQFSARAKLYVSAMGKGKNEGVRIPLPEKACDELYAKKVLGLMEGYYPFLTVLNDWDSDPHLIGHPQALVTDLRTGELRKQRPEDMIMRRTSVLPADSSSIAGSEPYNLLCDMFPNLYTRTAFLCDISTGLVGENIHDLVIAFEGVGGSGKSTLTGAINLALGSYSKGLNPGVIYDATGKTYIDPYDVAADRVAMQYLRFGLIQEVGASGSYRLNNDKLKQVSGGDEFTTRLARTSHQVLITPKLTVIFVGNELPAAKVFDPAVKRRLKLYRTTKKLQDQNDIYFRKKIQSDENLSILLRILIDHYQMIMQHGGALPPVAPEVQMWTRDWLETEDALAQFMFARIERTNHKNYVLTTHVVDAMKEFCQDSNINMPEEIKSTRGMNAKLQALGFKKSRKPEGIAVLGMQLIS